MHSVEERLAVISSELLKNPSQFYGANFISGQSFYSDFYGVFGKEKKDVCGIVSDCETAALGSITLCCSMVS